MTDAELTHLDSDGTASMVDVSGKDVIRRTAVAEACFHARPDTLDRLEAGDLPKGEALGTARIAGIQAAKDCARLIPLCHPLPLNHVGVDMQRVASDQIRVEAQVTAIARTGVEMEALTAVSIAALTLYDMTKAVQQDSSVEGVRVMNKTKEPA